jgi:hypothetical protein
MVAFSASRLICPVMSPINSTIPLIDSAAVVRRKACSSAASTRLTAAVAVSFDFTIASAISRTEALSSSAPAATDSIMPQTCWFFMRAMACAVTSLAYFTTLKGLPFRSRIGLYEA